MTGYSRRFGLIVIWVMGWVWAIAAGGGGLVLLVHRGPLPITNGWFAMFSGIAACPLSASLLQKYAGINIPGYVQFLAALAIFIAGRIAVVVLLHRPLIPQ